MRRRRSFARVIPVAVVVGVLAASSTPGNAQGAEGNGTTEIVDAASTAAIANAMQQFAQLIPSGYVSNSRPLVADSVVGRASSPTTTGDAALIASVGQNSDVIGDVAAGAAGNYGSTKQDGTGTYLVLAQFN